MNNTSKIVLGVVAVVGIIVFGIVAGVKANNAHRERLGLTRCVPLGSNYPSWVEKGTCMTSQSAAR